MTWVIIPAGFFEREKFQKLGDDRDKCVAMWTSAKSWAVLADTDGFIPECVFELMVYTATADALKHTYGCLVRMVDLDILSYRFRHGQLGLQVSDWDELTSYVARRKLLEVYFSAYAWGLEKGYAFYPETVVREWDEGLYYAAQLVDAGLWETVVVYGVKGYTDPHKSKPGAV